jgi:hypothetical protein
VLDISINKQIIWGMACPDISWKYMRISLKSEHLVWGVMHYNVCGLFSLANEEFIVPLIWI